MSDPDHVLVYAYDLPRNNGGMHWRVRQAQRDQAIKAFGDLHQYLRDKVATRRATVYWTRVLGPRQKAMDESNFQMLTKGCEDGLVRCGYLVDDSPKWCDRRPHVDDGTRRDIGPRIEIAIHYE